MLLTVKMKEEPRNRAAPSCWKRQAGSPLDSPEKSTACQHLDLSPMRPMLDFRSIGSIELYAALSYKVWDHLF